MPKLLASVAFLRVLAFCASSALADLMADAGVDLFVDEGEAVTLDGSGSTGDIVHSTWDFGDGVSWDDQLVVNHTYTDNELYVAMLTAWDNVQNQDWDTTLVTVFNVDPVAYTPDRTAVVDHDTEFVGSCTDPGVDDTHTYQWDFDNDFMWDETGQTAHWTFRSEGQFTIRFMATDDDGGTGLHEALIRVVPEPATLALLLIGGLALLRRRKSI